MKLRYTLLLSSAVPWFIFLSISATILSFFISLPYLLSYIGVGVLLYFILFKVLYKKIIKRLESLNQFLQLQQKILPHKETIGKDEIASLYSHFQKMLNTQQQNDEKMAQHLEEHEKINTKDYFVQLSHYDPLTSLPNRIFFNEMLNKTMGHATRNNKILAILIIDLDHFKNINDALGFEKGNDVLKEIAHRLSSAIRSGDIIARLGGDEFIVLLNDISHPKFASTIAEKLLQISAKPIKVNGREFAITASIGITIFPSDGNCLTDLLKNADHALYKAKSAGGSVYQYFMKEMTLEANKHIQLDQSLHKAVTNHEFILHYQPKINLAHGVITGVEALLRWVNPEVGLIRPNDFLFHLEENGLILPVGEWVLREACRANKSWQTQGFHPVWMAINLSSAQFKQPNIVKLLEKTIHDCDCDPAFLELEISEKIVMDDWQATTKKLRDIKDMGIKICIDDFGTGYTSINYLKQFPIDVLKIDQNFIRGIPNDPNDCAITSAVIALGHNLGIEVVAEGVETAQQLQFLVEHQCDTVQGYYFGRPVPEQKMVLQLSRNDKKSP